MVVTCKYHYPAHKPPPLLSPMLARTKLRDSTVLVVTKQLYTTVADKEMTFCTIFVNGYLWNAIVSLQSRYTMKVVSPAVDTYANKMKCWDLWEACEVHQFRLSMQHDNKNGSCATMAYQMSRSLFDLKVHYCTISSQILRYHHCRLLSLSS